LKLIWQVRKKGPSMSALFELRQIVEGPERTSAIPFIFFNMEEP
jgi:hypothetical protein